MTEGQKPRLRLSTGQAIAFFASPVPSRRPSAALGASWAVPPAFLSSFASASPSAPGGRPKTSEDSRGPGGLPWDVRNGVTSGHEPWFPGMAAFLQGAVLLDRPAADPDGIKLEVVFEPPLRGRAHP